MNWIEYFNSKILSPEEAVSHIHSGDRVVVGHACGEPSLLIEELVNHAADYTNVEIVHMVAMGKCRYAQPDMQEHFRHNALFVGSGTRKAVMSGRGDFTPCFFFEIPRLFSESLPVDVALVMVTPPDQDGMCSLGISVDYTLEAIKQAKTVIAQINPQMPYTYGNSRVSVRDIDWFVMGNQPIIELASPKIGPVEEMIARNCAQLIQDGDTLQLGIGAIPDAVLTFLQDKNDLGIHSEMFSDGVMKLMQSGVITNRKKTINPGKSVASFLMGSRSLYDFVHKNEDVMLAPVDYVNDPRIIGSHDNIVSINSCVEVDLMGQVASESIGPMQISGVGGQVDFVRGASFSKGGIAIIAMASTTKDNRFKIVSELAPGTAVTTSRNDVDYIVTEYGIAHLRGKTLRERAEALIEIAHPNHRTELKRALRK